MKQTLRCAPTSHEGTDTRMYAYGHHALSGKCPANKFSVLAV